MSRHTPGRLTLVSVLFAGAFSIGSGAAYGQQDYQDLFRRGLEARERKQWPNVADLMRQAIKLRSQESKEKVGGFGFFGGGTEYLPYYFLGEALYNANQCAEAVNSWWISDQQQVIQVRPDLLKNLRNGYLECEKRGVLPPSKLEPALARALQQYTEVNAIAKNVASLGEANPDIWRGDANLLQQYERATAELKSATSRFQSARATRSAGDIQEASAASERARTILATLEAGLGSAIDSRRNAQGLLREVGDSINLADALNTAVSAKKVPFTPAMTSAHQEARDGINRARERYTEGARTMSPQTLQLARTVALEAQAKLRQLLDDVTRVEKEIRQREFANALTHATDAFSLLDSAVATLDRFSVERPGVLPEDKAAERDAAQKDVARVRRSMETARKTENVAALAAAAKLATELRDRLNALIAAFGPLTLRDRGLNAVLEEGARLFFDGQYQQVVAALEPGETFGDDVPLRLHVHLFRAAALHQLFVRSGEKDQALRAQALQEVEHCRQIDSTFQPDARAFSPRFISFYQSVGGTPVPAVSTPPPAAQQ